MTVAPSLNSNNWADFTCLRRTKGHQALSSLNMWKGRRRAAFWGRFGFPNLERARAAKARKREERLEKERFARAHALNLFAIPDDCDYLLELNPRRSGRRR